MDNFLPHEREEIWFARVMMIFGVKEAVDVLLDVLTVLKARSGLPFFAVTTDDKLAIAYLISSAVVAVYLLGGGSVLSLLAYGHRAPRAYVFAEVPLPNWRRCLSVAFRSWGGFHIIAAVTSVALLIRYTEWPVLDSSVSARRYIAVETGWVLEHVALGFVLLAFGGKIAAFIIRTKDASDALRAEDKTSLPSKLTEL